MTFGGYNTWSFRKLPYLQHKDYKNEKELLEYYGFPNRYVAYENSVFEFIWDLKKKYIRYRQTKVLENFGNKKFVRLTEKEAMVLML